MPGRGWSRQFNRVRTKLTFLLLAFAALPGVGGFLSVLHNEAAFRATGLQRAGDAAVQIAETVDRNLLQRYADVQAFALNRATQVKAYHQSPDYPNPLTDAMNAYMRVYGVYRLMVLVDPKGAVLAVPTTDGAGKPLDTRWLYEHSFAGAPWLARTVEERFLEGRNGLTGTVVEGPTVVPEVAKLSASDGYSLVFAAPVRDKDGKVMAVWANFADFGLVDEIVASAHGHLAAAGLPGTGIAVLDPAGRVLADLSAGAGAGARDFQVIGVANWAEAGIAGAAPAVAGGSGALLAADQAVGYAHAAGAADFPGLGWSVLVRLPAAELFATIDGIEREMLLTGIATAVLTLLAGLGVGTLVTRPVQRLTGAMARLTQGELDTAVPGTAQGDEFGDMARAVQVFKDNAIAMRQLEAEQKERDRRAEEDKRRLLRDLAGRFEASVNGVVDTVSNSAETLENTAGTMAGTADQTARLSGAVAAAAEEATESVRAAAQATETLAAAIAQISARVGQSTRIAGAAVARAESSKDTVVGLTRAAEQIGEAVKLIHRIAGQTNILALNATIEAASAGEAGRGFAVVAGEVKALAKQIALATDEIGGLIASVQRSTGQAAVAMGEIGAMIGEIDSVAADIAAAVEEQHAATVEIARSAQQAAASTIEVSANIAHVTGAAGDTGSAAGAVLTAAHGVAEQSHLLQAEVAQFLREVRAA